MKNTIKVAMVCMTFLMYIVPVNAQTSKEHAKQKSSKVSSVLLSLYEESKGIEPSDKSDNLSLNQDLLLRKGNMVRIEATARKDADLLSNQLKSLGAEDIQVFQKLLDAWLPISEIPNLEELSELQFAKPAYRPVADIGSADSEGDSALAASMSRRQYCVDGDSVRIGVMSDSYNFLGGAAAGVASGDLPGAGNPNGYTEPVTVVSDPFSGIDEGRAMCEIVHDLAPGGHLFYATALGGQATFASNIMTLANTHQCDVIVDDIRYFEEPFYMDGWVAKACDKVYDQGVAYFASAGNYAQSSYESAFSPSRGSRFHDFDPGVGVDTMQSVTVNAGSSVNITLQWDDPWGTLTPNSPATDLDLYIYDAAGNILILSSIRDNINVTLEPTEFIGANTTGVGTVTFNIAVANFSGPNPSAFKWVIRNASGLVINDFPPTTVSAQATGYGHSNAEGANAVGACYWGSSPAFGVNPPVAESFTSSGGVQIRYDTNGVAIAPVIRSKPEFSASDGTSNTFFGGGNNFFGTSAAAPHAAAVAALMLEAGPTLTPAQVRSYLENSAIDMNTPNFDYLTGEGLIQADSAMKQVYDNLCQINAISVSSPPALELGDTTYSVEIMVEYEGVICTDSVMVNNYSFDLTNEDSIKVTLTGLPADGQAVDVTAMFKKSGCSLTVQSLFTASLTPTTDTLVVSEIMYDPPESGADSLEFIEIYNPTSSAINMAGYYFSEGVTYTFGNFVITPNGYVVVCEDSLALYNQFGASGFEWSGALTNGGEDIVLKNSSGVTIDSVDYDNSSPWPTGASGDGPSIVLCDWTLDNNLGSSWLESTEPTGKVINGQTLYGSPGKGDRACQACPHVDSTIVSATTCDSTQAGSVSNTHIGVDGCDSVHTVITVFDPGDTNSLAPVSVCDGDSIQIFGQYQNVQGLYHDTLSNVNGCDSILVQELKLNQLYWETLSSMNICSGDSLLIFGMYQKVAGIYYDTLQSVYGCDSVISKELVVDSVINTSDTLNICDGDSVLIFGEYKTTAGVYRDTSASSSGCDSIHSISVNVLPIAAGNDAISICEGDSAFIGGMYYKQAGTFYDTLTAFNSCDSIVAVLLSINPLDTTYQNLVTSDPGMAGVFDTTYTNILGCDSTVIYTVTYVPPVALDTLVITEIMYNPPESGSDSLEFIEIHNPMSSSVNLSGYNFAAGASHVFGNIIIPSGGYVVVCEDSTALYNQFGASGYEWSGSLVNGGELILLKDNLGNTIDSVEYDNGGSWPTGADGGGPSIVLCDPASDNSKGINWAESKTNTGIVINSNQLKGSPGTDDVACGACPTIDSTTVYEVTCDSTVAGITVINLSNINACDSVVTTITTYDPGNTIPLADKEICNGDSVMVFGIYQFTSGTYYDTLVNVNGCDSILSCAVIVHPVYSTSLPDMEVCEGDSMLVFGAYQSLSGTYFDTLQTINGCDSIVGKTLLLKRVDTINLFTTTMDSTLVGVFDSTYSNVVGCDSVVITTVIYVPAPCTNDSITMTVVTCDSTMAGTTIVLYPKSDGCDSVVTTISTYDPGSLTVLTDKVICDGDSVQVFGMYQSIVGTYYDTLVNINGCDSILSCTVIINPSYSMNLPDMEICEGDSILLFGHYQTMAGVYYDSLQAVHGCDSVVAKTLHVKRADTINASKTTMDSTLAGVFDTTYSNVFGCDSLVITTVTYVPAPCTNDSITMTAVTCDSTMAGTTIMSYPKSDGCDSVVTTITTYDPGSLTVLTDKVICDGDSVEVFGTYQTMAGTYNNVLTNINGCDSNISCMVIVKPGYVDSTYVQICDGDSLLLGGGYQSLTGHYVDSLSTIMGCDSIIVTELTVTPEVNTSDTETICEGDSVLIFGDYERIAGSYIDTAQSLDGCDSIHTVVLIVKPVVAVSVADSICQGSGIVVGGAYQTTAGTYYDTLMGANGCDSIIVTMLTIRTDTGCGIAPIGDSIVLVTDTGWMKSTVTNIAEAGGYPWPGVSNLPAVGTFTLTPEIGQPHPWHSLDSVDGARVFKSGNGVTFFRTTFTLTVDTGVMAQFRSFMDDGMEIYVNGQLMAREDDREVSNAGGDQHNLLFMQNGERSNGHNGEQEFDIVNNYRMDSVVHTGVNELIIALRNGPSVSEKGGFSFRMDLKTGQPYMPALTGFIVSDVEWEKSSVTTPGGSSWNWPGVANLPAPATFTEAVDLGQPYGWYSTEEVPESYAIKADENVTYYRRRFWLSDTGGMNARLRTTFDENIMVFINDSLIAGQLQHGMANRTLPAHDVAYPTGGIPVNGNAGGDMFMQVDNVDFDGILNKGDNYITVALQNRSGDRGGFSLRLDLDKGGAAVIRKSDESDNVIASRGPGPLEFELYPNPSSGVFVVNLQQMPSNDNEVSIFDVNGKLLLSRSIEETVELDISKYPKGFYFVHIRSGEITKTKPLVRF